jgi:hypothetical protein
LCRHKPRSSSGGRSTPSTDTPKITIYNCSIRPIARGSRRVVRSGARSLPDNPAKSLRWSAWRLSPAAVALCYRTDSKLRHPVGDAVA